MYIDQNCIGCGDCRVFCPQGAIVIEDDQAHIETHLCVECGVCIDSADCPQEAIRESTDDYSWTKRLFGRLLDAIPGSVVRGRAGGYDVKTNDATGRIPEGKAVIRVELMRPMGGITIAACQAFKNHLEEAGFFLKPLKRYDLLMSRLHELPEDILQTRVLTTSFESVLSPDQVGPFLHRVERYSKDQGLWVSANLAATVASLGKIQKTLSTAGVKPRLRAKINLGIARRTEE